MRIIELKRKIRITSVCCTLVSALVFTGVGIGIGYGIFYVNKKDLPEFTLNEKNKIFHVGESGNITLKAMNLPNDYRGQIVYSLESNDDGNNITLNGNVLSVSNNLLPKDYNVVIKVTAKANGKYNEKVISFNNTITIKDILPNGFHRIPYQDQTNIWINQVVGKNNLNWMIFFNHSREEWNTFSSQIDVIGKQCEPNDPMANTTLLFLKGGTASADAAPQIRIGYNIGNVDLISGNHWKTKVQIDAVGTSAGGLPISWYGNDTWFAIQWTQNFSYTFSNKANFPGNDWLRNGLNWFLAAPN